MYEPAGSAVRVTEVGVEVGEAAPAARHADLVHRVVSVRSTRDLDADHRFHALPDACTYLVLDVRDPRVCGVTRLGAASQELSLGRSFHFVNVRLRPGVWRGQAGEGIVQDPYRGPLPLSDYAARLRGRDFGAQQEVVAELLDHLVADGLLHPDPTTRRIFEHVEEICSVEDMARAAHLSTRQLQRVLNRSLGLAPHDLLKVVRLQHALRTADRSSYADQSHFIRTFRAATGYTPREFARHYDV